MRGCGGLFVFVFFVKKQKKQKATNVGLWDANLTLEFAMSPVQVVVKLVHSTALSLEYCLSDFFIPAFEICMLVTTTATVQHRRLCEQLLYGIRLLWKNWGPGSKFM
jgi:hypothetical protein